MINRTRISVFAIGLLALVASLWMAPAKLHAGCGDYVKMGSSAHNASPTIAQQPVAGSDRASLPSAPKPPCRGAACSRHPLPLSVPATAPTTSLTEPSLAPEAPPVGPPSAGTRCCGGDRARFPSAFALQVYHPPRSA